MKKLTIMSTPIQGLRGQDQFVGSAAIDSGDDGNELNACNLTPLQQRMFFTIPGQAAGVAFIICLLFSGRPSAIIRRIAFIVVDSIKRTSQRSFTHISKKIIEREPAVANRNPATAIIGEVAMCGVEATFFHTRPSLIGSVFNANAVNYCSSSVFAVLHKGRISE